MLNESRLSVAALITVFMASCLSAWGATVYPVTYPGQGPGMAEAELSDDGFTVRNDVLDIAWRIEGKKILLETVVDLAGSNQIDARDGQLFVAALAKGRKLKGSDFRIESEPELVRLEVDPSARRLVERFPGWRITAQLSGPDRIEAEWSATLRDESNYAVCSLTLRPGKKDLPIEELALISLSASNAEVAGSTQGAPVFSDNLFFAYEHPMAENRIDGGHVTCALKRTGTLRSGSALAQTSVIGVVPEGQRRRGFLYYVERERAHPFRPFLHYNSWYDISWGNRKFSEAEALAAIELFGEELVRKRGVEMDSFVFDDGWDDDETLWQFHDGFPNGFRTVKVAAAKHGASVGAWLSPFGGYGEARRRRLEFGKEQGFETNRQGFSLAGPKYYARFRGICEEMVREQGVDFFKFDGMGTGGHASAEGGGEYIEDIEALMRMVGELREMKPDLYVSATTGTWCSPYFLWHADSTWRGAGDMGFAGKGSKRQQWITYRDLHTYRNVVQQGPLYPLNSLMTQGIAHSVYGSASELDDDIHDMSCEISTFFGSGTGLQELYIAPQLLNEAQWDLLARTARWARANADVFVDSHWVGGDPGKGEVYGWASWTPRKGILVLRNPSERSQEIQIDVAEAFELPDDAPKRYKCYFPQDRSLSCVLVGGKPHTFGFQAFDALVLDAEPVSE